jgi:phosphopantetheinyl transferase (holo-ACP synthase)
MRELLFDKKVWIKIVDSRDYSKEKIIFMYERLSEYRKNKADTIKSDKNKALSILAGYTLENMLNEVLWPGDCQSEQDKEERKLVFSVDEAGKPFLADQPEAPSFSISHSGNFAAVAVSLDTNLSVGIDIEDFTSLLRKEKNIVNISKKFFSDDEIKEIMLSVTKNMDDHENYYGKQENASGEDTNKIKNFMKIWTMKEAAMKAKELPLLNVLREVKYVHDDPDMFQRMADEYVLSVYVSPKQQVDICTGSGD